MSSYDVLVVGAMGRILRMSEIAAEVAKVAGAPAIVVPLVSSRRLENAARLLLWSRGDAVLAVVGEAMLFEEIEIGCPNEEKDNVEEKK
jgi:hypothetical protein